MLISFRCLMMWKMGFVARYRVPCAAACLHTDIADDIFVHFLGFNKNVRILILKYGTHHFCGIVGNELQ